MKITGQLMLTLLLCAASISSMGQKKDIEAVSAAHRAFEADMAAKRFAEAADRTTADTKAYLDLWLQHALHGDSATVAGLPGLLRIGVFNYRHRVSVEEAQKADYRSFFNFLCTLDLITPKAFASTGFTVEVKKDTAMVKATLAGNPPTAEWPYVCAQKQWQLNLVPMLVLSAAQLDKAFAAQLMPPNDLIFLQMERHSGRTPSAAIWRPMVK